MPHADINFVETQLTHDDHLKNSACIKHYEVWSGKVWLPTFNSVFTPMYLLMVASWVHWIQRVLIRTFLYEVKYHWRHSLPLTKGQKRQRQLIINPRRDAIFIFIKMLKASWLRQPEWPDSPFQPITKLKPGGISVRQEVYQVGRGEERNRVGPGIINK